MDSLVFKTPVLVTTDRDVDAGTLTVEIDAVWGNGNVGVEVNGIWGTGNVGLFGGVELDNGMLEKSIAFEGGDGFLF